VHQLLASILWPNQDEKEHVLRSKMESALKSHSEIAPTTNHRQQIYRLKGILSVGKLIGNTCSTDHRRFIVQGVYDLWDIHPCTTPDLFWKDEEDRISKIIIIGRNLEVSTLKDGFNKCKLG
jgi:G3E family GTPase